MLVILRLLGHTLFVALRIDQFANRLRTQLRRCQALYFCAGKASKVRTWDSVSERKGAR
jgi:hypothetical protein